MKGGLPRLRFSDPSLMSDDKDNEDGEDDEDDEDEDEKDEEDDDEGYEDEGKVIQPPGCEEMSVLMSDPGNLQQQEIEIYVETSPIL